MSALSKEDLVELLAARDIRREPRLYAGHEESARAFWRLNGGTRDDLLTAAMVFGLVPDVCSICHASHSVSPAVGSQPPLTNSPAPGPTAPTSSLSSTSGTPSPG